MENHGKRSENFRLFLFFCFYRQRIQAFLSRDEDEDDNDRQRKPPEISRKTSTIWTNFGMTECAFQTVIQIISMQRAENMRPVGETSGREAEGRVSIPRCMFYANGKSILEIRATINYLPKRTETRIDRLLIIRNSNFFIEFRIKIPEQKIVLVEQESCYLFIEGICFLLHMSDY